MFEPLNIQAQLLALGLLFFHFQPDLYTLKCLRNHGLHKFEYARLIAPFCAMLEQPITKVAKLAINNFFIYLSVSVVKFITTNLKGLRSFNN